MDIRNEYPRPQFKRNRWTNLNGTWDFCFDDLDCGQSEAWYSIEKKFSKKIIVPFSFQTKKSEVRLNETHEIVWYKRSLEIKKNFHKRYLLHFGAVDYQADVYINEQHSCQHIGGQTSFSLDITNEIKSGQNEIVVRAFDPQTDESILRGKQFWKKKSEGIWYTNTTGIWQTVWLEEVNEVYIKNLKLTPLYDDGKIRIKTQLNKFSTDMDLRLSYKIMFKGVLVARGSMVFTTDNLDLSVDVLAEKIFRTNFHGKGWSWTPEAPNLFDLILELHQDDNVVDNIASYFGFRKVHQENGMVYLNNKPYYQKLILDQGYWPESLLTAPNDESFKKDIELAKQMGFNGCRKHQKTEDPRFLYWADKLGYLVWGECASAPIFNDHSVNELMREWKEIIDRDYNHPCIVTWVPLNESWGTPKIQRNRQQQHLAQAIYHYIHSLDETRLVISNDGWSLTETDICAIHNYAHGNSDEKEKYIFYKNSLETKENILGYPSTPWPIYANGFSNKGEPILLTEFGGIGFKTDNQSGWGYTSVTNESEFMEEYQRVMAAVYASKIIWGYCYTQLTDVEQEKNGLLSYYREAKCDLKKIKAVNDGYHIPTLKI